MRFNSFWSTNRRKAALVAVPLTVGLATGALPAAWAQSSFGSLGPAGSGTDYLIPQGEPERSPIKTTDQDIAGLPDGVEVDHVDWLGDRRVNLFIKSKAMPDQLMKVEVLLARDWYSSPDKTFPTLYTLDGMRARNDQNGWTLETNIAQQFADRNVNVVLPVGGAGSFYTDWQDEVDGKAIKWETFISKELPPIMEKGWRSNGTRGVVGLSMGGTAAVNLAERNPGFYKFVASYSGYLDTTGFGMQPAILGAIRETSGMDGNKMWGPAGSQGWIDHDPKLGMNALKGTTVYVSSGNGSAGFADTLPGGPSAAAVGLETISNLSTHTFVSRAKSEGIPVVSRFYNSGTHNWPYWQVALADSWPTMAKALNLSEADRGADCTPIGAIGAGLKGVAATNLGSCVNDEYDGDKGGRIQDFRGGRAFWSEKTGAHYLWGRISAHYSEIGATNSWLGYPTSEEFVTPDGKGRFVTFENGYIYWSPETGAHAVTKPYFEKWGDKGFEAGVLGYPTSEKLPAAGGSWQSFEHGYIVRTKDGKTFVVQGEIAKKYKELDGPAGDLGFPKSDEYAIPGGAFSQFEKGNIYWSPKNGAHSIAYGAIFDQWGKDGYEQGKFGYPTSDMKKIPAGGLTISFEHGKLSEINGHVVAS